MTRRALLALPIATAARGAELKPATLSAYETYLRLTREGNDRRFQSTGKLLWADTRPAVVSQLRAGQVAIEALRTAGPGGKEIKIPDGLIHHWIGAAFIEGATLPRAIALVQDYDRHQETYKPDVMKSKLLKRNGNEFEVFLRFFKKKVIAVVLNTVHKATFFPVDERRQYSRSDMVRVAELMDAANPDGPEKPQGEDHGFLWRLASEWRFEQRDGGVYIESESITLTRDIPIGLGWMVGPFVKSLPRETLQNTMNATRAALQR